MMTRRLSVVLCLLLLTASAFAQSKKHSKGLLPDSHKDLWFGMPMSAFGEARPFNPDSLVKVMEFRHSLVIEQPPGSVTGLRTVVYYFDAEGEAPLYEMILIYADEASRDEAAAKLFGPPNADKEWHFPKHKGFPFRAWPYQTKLVLAAALPGTEWEGEW
jgi:hypothetical protein